MPASNQTEVVHQISDNRIKILALLRDLRAVEEQLQIVTDRLMIMTADVHRFEYKYHATVGNLYVRLDELEAEIAEHLARNNSTQAKFAERARTARQKAEETAYEAHFEEAADNEKDRASNGSILPKVADLAKSLHRKIAKLIHPDLAIDDIDKSFREQIMVAANLAKESGDIQTLERIFSDWETTNVSLEDPDVTRIAQLTSYINQARQKLTAVEIKMRHLKSSEIYKLKVRIETAEMEGIDLLGRMVLDIQAKVDEAESRLAQIQGESEDLSVSK